MPIDTTLRDALSAVTTASLARVLARRGVPACTFDGPSGSGRAVGPAVTLRMIPDRGDGAGELADAVGAVPEGSFVVIDTGRSGLPLPFSAMLTAHLARSGAAGLVTDGALASEGALPTWSARARGGGGLALAGSGEAVACAGAAVHPGDIVVAGPDGVVVVPRAIAESVALEAVEQQRLDLWLQREAETGTPLAALLPPDAATLARFEAETRQG